MTARRRQDDGKRLARKMQNAKWIIRISLEDKRYSSKDNAGSKSKAFKLMFIIYLIIRGNLLN